MYKIKILLFFLFSLFFVLALFRSVNSYAMKPYGVMINKVNSYWVRHNYKKAFSILKVFALKGKPAAQRKLGFMYFKGYGMQYSSIVNLYYIKKHLK